MNYLLELWNIQWFNALGIMLGILGCLYTSCNYLDSDSHILKAITKSIAISVVVVFLFTTFSLIFLLFNYLGDLFLNIIDQSHRALPNPDSTVGFSIIIPGGLIVGVVLGLCYSILKERESTFKDNLFLFGFIGLMLMLGCSIGLVTWSLYPNLFSQHQEAFSLVFYSAGDIGGCLFGIMLIRIRRSSFRNLVLYLLISIVFTSLFLLFSSQNDHIFENVLEKTIFNSQLGIIIGISVNEWLQVKTDRTNVTWDRFIFWLLFGGLGLPLVYLLIFNINKSNYLYLYFILHYFTIFGIINSGGDTIIKRIKFNSKARADWSKPHPKVNWKKFVFGLLIGMLYILPTALFTLITDPLLGYDINNNLYDLIQNIDFSILVGLIISCVYGFGPLIIFTIDDLRQKRLGRIGVGIIVLGGVMAFFPH